MEYTRPDFHSFSEEALVVVVLRAPVVVFAAEVVMQESHCFVVEALELEHRVSTAVLADYPSLNPSYQFCMALALLSLLPHPAFVPPPVAFDLVLEQLFPSLRLVQAPSAVVSPGQCISLRLRQSLGLSYCPVHRKTPYALEVHQRCPDLSDYLEARSGGPLRSRNASSPVSSLLVPCF